MADDEDIAAFVTAVLDPTHYATLYPNRNFLNADANGDRGGCGIW